MADLRWSHSFVLVAATSALVVGGAVLTTVSAEPATAADGDAVAAKICRAAFDGHDLTDDAARSLDVRDGYWATILDDDLVADDAESAWNATDSDRVALEGAFAELSARALDELSPLDDDALAAAENDLLWIMALPDAKQADELLAMPLDERTKQVSSLRAGDVPDPSDAGAVAVARPVSGLPIAEATLEPVAPVDALPAPEPGVTAAVSFRQIMQFTRSLVSAEREEPDDAIVQRREWSATPSLLAAEVDRLVWTAEQPESFSGDAIAGWSADVRDRVDGIRRVLALGASAPVGILDDCVIEVHRSLVGGSSIDDAMNQARSLVAKEIEAAEGDGLLASGTPGSRPVRACVSAMADRSDDIGLDVHDRDAIVRVGLAPALDRQWNSFVGDETVPNDELPDAVAKFWSRPSTTELAAKYDDELSQGIGRDHVRLLEQCERAIVVGGDVTDPSAQERARAVLAKWIAEHPDASSTTPGSLAVRACDAAVTARSTDLGLSQDGVDALQQTEAVARWNDLWLQTVDANGSPAAADLPGMLAKFWATYRGDDALTTDRESLRAAVGDEITALADKCTYVVADRVGSADADPTDVAATVSAEFVQDWIDSQAPASDPSPDPTITEVATASPDPTSTGGASATPDPTDTAQPSATPDPSATATATDTAAPAPTATESAAPTVSADPTPADTVDPDPSATATTPADPTPEPTATGAPQTTVAPSAQPSSTPVPIDTASAAPTRAPDPVSTTVPTRPVVRPATASSRTPAVSRTRSFAVPASVATRTSPVFDARSTRPTSPIARPGGGVAVSAPAQPATDLMATLTAAVGSTGGMVVLTLLMVALLCLGLIVVVRRRGDS